MANKIYIVKNLTPWMIDELIAFSEITIFDIIFLRTQDDFYKESIQKLESNHINIYIKPYSWNNFFNKIVVILKFFFTNLIKFEFNYNGIIGIKSVIWFLRLDLSKFTSYSNIHAQFATQPALVSLLVKRYYSNKPLLSFTFHAHDIYFKNKWFNLLLKNCHKAFSISNFNIEYVQERYVVSDKIELSRLGVFRNNIKSNRKKESKIFTLGLISWFVEKKGIMYLLEAFKILKQNGYENIKLKLAGDGPLKEKYLRYIDENDLKNNIDYIGKIKGDEKEIFFTALDAFILPSIKLKNDQDGIPVVLMEAIAYGLPVISTDVSGIPEICIDNYNGSLIKEKNVQNIFEAIVELYKNKNKRIVYSKNSCSLSTKYDIALNSKKKLMKMNWI